MSELARFREYAKGMAQGGHTDQCVIDTTEAKRRWSYRRMFREWHDDWGPQPAGPPEPCRGECLSASDRELFAHLAQEVDEYLDPHPELF